ncbi:MAG: hypothetical protein V1720_03260 [bacterium]
MIPEIRKRYNSEFSENKYQVFLKDIWSHTNKQMDFRICETPLFLDEKLSGEIQKAANELADYLLTDEFKKKSTGAVPDMYTVPNEDEHPLFLQIDLAITKDENGNYAPRLIELQGFPSLYAFQVELDETVRRHFNIPIEMSSYFNTLDKEKYLALFKKVVIADHDPENVILLEIEPHDQKTRIDFYLTQKYLGIEPVCISDIRKQGRSLFYKKDSREIKIERIYNRVIFDELERKTIESSFDLRDNLDIEWAGHPNWFFRISKYTLPQFNSIYAPKCYYLNQLNELPDDLSHFVLKPLYSFAGSGVKVEITKKEIEEISDKDNYILQQKVEYAPLIETPDGYSKAEIRMMFIWEDNPILVNNLLRTSKGKMMGVDYNKNKTWVGSNIVFHP